MTCREKWEQDHPGISFEANILCPVHFKYADIPYNCPDVCEACWNREIPEEKENNKMIYAHTDLNDISNNQSVATIKDSGDRTEFSSGAVRDMREGKGRCDLLPLEVVSDMLATKKTTHDAILQNIAAFMSERSTMWLFSALENFAADAYDDSLPTMFLEVAKHYEEGAKKYSPDNWRKGIPVYCYIDSAVRHYLKWKRGDNDEPHDRAFVWNLLCCMWEIEYGEEWRQSIKEATNEN